MMRIAALNIRSGGGTRVDALLRHVELQCPDVIVFTEWRNNLAGQRISDWARGRGWQSANCTDGTTANGVFVAASHEIVGVSRTPAGTGPGALMQVSFPKFTLLACYFPQRSTKQPFFERCAEIALEHTDKPFLLIGDLNTGNQIADKDARGGAYHCAPMFDSLTAPGGLQDLWRLSNGRAAREWTWLSNRNNGFRIDHAFGNKAFVELMKPTCRYDHVPRLDRLTDHSMILVDFVN